MVHFKHVLKYLSGWSHWSHLGRNPKVDINVLELMFYLIYQILVKLTIDAIVSCYICCYHVLIPQQTVLSSHFVIVGCLSTNNISKTQGATLNN